MARDVDRLARLARRAGWRVVITKRSHLKFLDPEGRLVAVASSTPSDVRSIRNLSADLRRAGLDLKEN